MHSNWSRRVIPRWRSSLVTAGLPESLPLQVRRQIRQNPLASTELQRRLQEWQVHKSVGMAADLLNFAHLPGLAQQLREPAQQILSAGDAAPYPLRQLAGRILGSEVNRRREAKSPETKREKLTVQIRSLKTLLQENPRDAILLVDLARLYSAMGMRDQAKRAILTAIDIYPNHRHVLRSATRFLVHVGEVDRALHLLKRSPRSETDPWILASQVAVETILGKTGRSIKRGRIMIESNTFDPVHISELSSAIATVHVMSGENQAAKRAFNTALVGANDNSVAQAVWAAQHFNLKMNFEQKWFSERFSAESNVYKMTAEGDFEGAVSASIDWYEDEPFSTRPMKAASFAASILSDYEACEEFSREGLSLDKHDSELLNNLAFGLAAQDRTQEAVEWLRTAMRLENQKEGAFSGHSLANAGMILLREGMFEEGERMYRLALHRFEGQANLESRALAYAFMAREAFAAKAPNAASIVTEAREVVANSNSAAAEQVINPVLAPGDEIQAHKQLNFKQHIKWEHDSEQNVLILDKGDPFSVKKAPSKK